MSGGSGEKHGIAAAVGALDVGAAVPAGLEDVQEDMFDAVMPRALSPARASGVARPGRPLGARNRSTAEFRRWALERYGSPTIALLEVGARAAEDLAKELRLTRVVDHLAPGETALKTLHDPEGNLRGYVVWDLERAFAKQMAALQAAQPYVDQKQPVAIEVSDKPRGLLVINMGGADGADDAQLVFDPPQQNQQVIDAEPSQSDGNQSDGGAMSNDIKELGYEDR